MQSVEGHLYIDLISIIRKNINNKLKTKSYINYKQEHFEGILEQE